MEYRQLLRELRCLNQPVRAPSRVLGRVLETLEIGDAYAPLETALGTVYVAYNRHGISAVLRTQTPEEFEQEFRRRFGRPIHPAGDAPCWLDNRFDLRNLSEFERAALMKALEIPRGEVRTYAWIAAEIGRPGAVRAVGSALGKNPIPLFIPCHRVVRSDGHIGEYSMGGPEAKRTLLASEGVEPEMLERMAGAGVRYVGSETTQIFCFPTCRAARRITDRHRVMFRSEAKARAAGYRPCQICRPTVALAR
jgi:O-6-methylguanine DNA methyltransferase